MAGAMLSAMDAILYLSGPLRLARVADLSRDMTDREEQPAQACTEPGHVRLRATRSTSNRRAGTRPASWPTHRSTHSASA